VTGWLRRLFGGAGSADWTRGARPRCLAAFTISAARASERPVRTLERDLACAACEGVAFTLTSHVRRPAGEEPDETGVAATCEECGRSELLFDEVVHGYDGELGHWSHRDHPGVPEDPITSAGGSVTVAFTYNVEADELAQVGRDGGVAPIDLFDWIEVSHGGRIVWERECA